MNAENWIVKSNALIESKGHFTALELKVILSLISEIKIEDEDFKEYDISVNALKNIVDSKNNAFYLELKRACEKLVSKTITLEKYVDEENPKKLKNKKSFLVISYLSSAEYVDGESKIKLSFDPKLKPYLLDLKGSFTRYQLKHILALKSQYSIRIYELIKPVENTSHQKRVIPLKELRELLGIEEKEYSRFYDFERKVLEVSKKQISEQTDISLNYRKIKKGRSVSAIEFQIYSSKESNQTEQSVYYGDIEDEQVEKIKTRVGITQNISAAQVMEIYEIASEMTCDLIHIDRFEYMTLNYYYTLSKKPSSFFAYYKKALKNDYAKACQTAAKEKSVI